MMKERMEERKRKMRTFVKCTAIALIFFMGTLSVIHVDRQTSMMHRRTPEIMKTVEETAENIIEKYASLR